MSSAFCTELDCLDLLDGIVSLCEKMPSNWSEAAVDDWTIIERTLLALRSITIESTVPPPFVSFSSHYLLAVDSIEATSVSWGRIKLFRAIMMPELCLQGEAPRSDSYGFAARLLSGLRSAWSTHVIL